ncbi:MAG: LytTR family DNA-binding domain-containing protein [Cellulosilyticaceae bacterium]
MKINKYLDANLQESRVDIYYQREDSEVKLLLDYLKETHTLMGNVDGTKKVLKPNQIYYFETVDHKCFAYTEDEVYKVDLSLQEVEDIYMDKGFIRVNKSMVLNVLKVDYIKMEVNMRINAYLENGECIIINRSYRSSFNTKLLELRNRREI